MNNGARTAAVAVLLLAFAFPTGGKAREPDAPRDASAAEFVRWLLKEKEHLRELPFPDLIFYATGKRVLPVQKDDETDRRVLEQIGRVLDEVVRRMNAPDSPLQGGGRINEASSHFENMIRDLANEVPGLTCDFPLTAAARVQRSGYPDLRLVDQKSGRVYYMDPKLHTAASRDSTFRTFYFEPKVATNKVREDAVHLILGFEHQERKGSQWHFSRWRIVDLSGFKVRLKAEFQGSNRDIYRPEAIMREGAAE